MQARFDAIVMAGYNPDRKDPLTDLSGEPHKALMKVDGRPMVWHAVRALHETGRVDRIVVIGLSPEDGVDFPCEVDSLPDQGGMLSNCVYSFRHVSSWQDHQRHVILVGSDVPLMTGEMVNWFVDACQPYDVDVYWGLVERSVMEATFPGSKRSYMRLVEGQFCSGDIFLGRIRIALERNQLILELSESRKNIFRQVRILGWNVLVRYLFRRLRAADLIEVAERNLHMTGRPVFLPYAEMGMDVDKPHQLAQVEAYLQAHPRTYPAGSQSSASG